MTYLNFLLLFVCLPMVLLAARLQLLGRLGRQKDGGGDAPAEGAIPLAAFVKAALVLVVLAVVYTTPWDNYLVKHKIWWYGPDRVLGTIHYVPIEEYAFFVLQTVFTCLWGYTIYRAQHTLGIPGLIPAHSRLPWPLTALWQRDHLPIPATDCWPTGESPSRSGRPLSFYLVLGLYVAAFALGVYGLFWGAESWRYLGLILSWAMPIAIIQWLLGGEHLLVNGRFFGFMLLPPTVYLWLADAYAIKDGIWTISERFTLGLKAGTLPLEEALFFAVTNLMVTQGLILFVLLLPFGRMAKQPPSSTTAVAKCQLPLQDG